jgi:hypothetical protein
MRRFRRPMPNDALIASGVTVTVSVAKEVRGNSSSPAGTRIESSGGHVAAIRTSGMANPMARIHQPTWVCL